jgi:hypothetical protein
MRSIKAVLVEVMLRRMNLVMVGEKWTHFSPGHQLHRSL